MRPRITGQPEPRREPASLRARKQASHDAKVRAWRKRAAETAKRLTEREEDQ